MNVQGVSLSPANIMDVIVQDVTLATASSMDVVVQGVPH
jgi:hypothetical protein